MRMLRPFIGSVLLASIPITGIAQQKNELPSTPLTFQSAALQEGDALVQGVPTFDGGACSFPHFRIESNVRSKQKMILTLSRDSNCTLIVARMERLQVEPDVAVPRLSQTDGKTKGEFKNFPEFKFAFLPAGSAAKFRRIQYVVPLYVFKAVSQSVSHHGWGYPLTFEYWSDDLTVKNGNITSILANDGNSFGGLTYTSGGTCWVQITFWNNLGCSLLYEQPSFGTTNSRTGIGNFAHNPPKLDGTGYETFFVHSLGSTEAVWIDSYDGSMLGVCSFDYSGSIVHSVTNVCSGSTI